LQHVLLCCSMLYCGRCSAAVFRCAGAAAAHQEAEEEHGRLAAWLQRRSAHGVQRTLQLYPAVLYVYPASFCCWATLVQLSAPCCNIVYYTVATILQGFREGETSRLTLRQPRLQSATTHQGLIAAECGAADRRQMTSDASNAPYRANCARRAGVAVGMRLSAANGQNGTQPHDVPSAECWIILCCTTLSKCCTGGTAR
jgi:hypothetical protein